MGEWGEDGASEGGKGLELGTLIPLNGDGFLDLEEIELEDGSGWDTLHCQVEMRAHLIGNFGRRPFKLQDCLLEGEMVSKGKFEIWLCLVLLRFC